MKPLSDRHILIILDGYGIAEDPSVSAIDAARKPFIDGLLERYPHATLDASGRSVGLPRGQMGNSEVGHMNLGAGRVVYQDITRIDKAIEDGVFFENDALCHAVDESRRRGSDVHLFGLLSDGGVHSHVDHLVALLTLCRRRGLPAERVHVHAFTDGRDTDPRGGAGYARDLTERATADGLGRIKTVVGRYYAMDRDKRWDRTRLASEALTKGDVPVFASAEEGLDASYAEGITDEFVRPFVVEEVPGDAARTRIGDRDIVICFNFRADRARQISRALAVRDFVGFERRALEDIHYVTLTPYEASFGFPVAFPRVDLVNTIGEVVSVAGKRQLRAAETEKYAHVTYFFSGGREEPFEREERILIPSPAVATYDLQPEMSARPLADAVSEAIVGTKPELVILNFANPDMVGHTGDFDAAVRAIEAVDACLEKVVLTARDAGYSVEIIADHGNADKMRNPDGSPHTAHTTALVPHLIIADGFRGPIRDGKLGDVAPTILRILGMSQPEEMTGTSLID